MMARPSGGEEVDFRDWRAVNVENLVIGEVEPNGPGGYLVKFRLYDVFRGEQITGKRVLVVEDGPTLTHGGMKYGAATIAARRIPAPARVQAGMRAKYKARISAVDHLNSRGKPLRSAAARQRRRHHRAGHAAAPRRGDAATGGGIGTGPGQFGR